MICETQLTMPMDAKVVFKREWKVPPTLRADLFFLMFAGTLLWIVAHLAVMTYQEQIDKARDQREMQRVEELKKLLNPNQLESEPKNESTPDPDLRNNSFSPGEAMRVYLSARFQRQQEMRMYAEQLRADQIEVVSAWHDVDVPSVDGFTGLDDQRRAWLAMLDLQQLSGTNAVVLFGDDPMQQLMGMVDDNGTRHVTAGTALALGKRILLVGTPENSFYCLPDVERFPAWPEAFARILELRGGDAMTTREAAIEAGTTVQQIGMWIREGRLPAAKHRGRYVIGRNDLDRAKAQHLRARADALTNINADRLFPVKAGRGDAYVIVSAAAQLRKP